ncbi:MAG: hypothetical protein AAFP19_13380 [Bacteroidota bacterium]
MKPIYRFPFWYLPLLVFSLLGMEGIAQDYKADLEKMYRIYEKATDVYMKMRIRAYTNEQPTQALFEKKATIRKQGNNYLYDLDDSRMLINDRYQVIVDRSEKMILLEKREAEPEQQLGQWRTPELDSILSKHPNVEYKGIEEGGKCYVVEDGEQMIKKVKVIIDQDSGLLKKLTYWYNDQFYLQQNGFVIIDFKEANVNPEFAENTFSESQFIQKKDKEFLPVSTYKNYEIVNTVDYEF